MKRLIVGGEALETQLARRTLESFGSRVEIYNEYGPTEATVGCMLHRFDPARDRRAFVPVGRPAANARLYVLDPELRPVAENVLGEMYIAGECLAQGYLNRAELTAERFVADPYRAGARMYGSGDMARWLPEGVIEYVGRTDGQVKYHGYRVELGELKAALNRHAQVRDSTVVMVEERGGGGVLVAYYVSRQEVEARELREWMASQVIEEILPNMFIHLKKLPLTLNGKVNYEALPSIEEASRTAGRSHAAARSPVESALAEIWAEVLGVKDIGAHDNFFELGGHSLLATQVLSKVREVFHVEIPLRTLFEKPTVSGLASSVAARLGGTDRAESPLLETAPRGEDLPLSFAQQRLWLIDQLEPNSPAYNVPVALRLDGRFDAEAMRRTLSEIVRRHEVLRTTFALRDGRPVQVIGQPEQFELPVLDLSEMGEAARGMELQRLLAAEALRAFDLSKGPLLRAGLIRLGEDEQVLHSTMHHIISDGWSMGVLIREVAALYEAYSAGRASPLAELPIQYADYAVWQRRWLTGDVLDRQLAYWRRQLGGVPALDLPTDRPRPAAQSYRGARQPFALTEGLSAALTELSRREGVTLHMTLLAAFQTLLHRYTGQEDIAVGSAIANRNHAGIENLIGFFVNMLVLRADLSGNPGFRELLGRVREVCLGAYAHQDVPFEKLVEELQPGRDLSRPPFFNVVFQSLNNPMPALEFSGLRVTPVDVQLGMPHFDLILSVAENKRVLAGTLEYNTDLFDPSTACRMLEHFKALLEGVVEQPERGLLEFPLEAHAATVMSGRQLESQPVFVDHQFTFELD